VGISTKEISEVIKERLKDFDATLVATDVGRIVATGDGIAQIYGLQNARASCSSSRTKRTAWHSTSRKTRSGR